MLQCLFEPDYTPRQNRFFDRPFQPLQGRIFIHSCTMTWRQPWGYRKEFEVDYCDSQNVEALKPQTGFDLDCETLDRMLPLELIEQIQLYVGMDLIMAEWMMNLMIITARLGLNSQSASRKQQSFWHKLKQREQMYLAFNIISRNFEDEILQFNLTNNQLRRQIQSTRFNRRLDFELEADVVEFVSTRFRARSEHNLIQQISLDPQLNREIQQLMKQHNNTRTNSINRFAKSVIALGSVVLCICLLLLHLC